MEISSSVPMGQALFQYKVGTAVQKLVMDQVEVSADALRQMMERSVTPHLGGNIDIKG